MLSIKKSRMLFRSVHHQRLHASLARHSVIKLQAKMNTAPAEQNDGPDYVALRLALQESGSVCRLFGRHLGTRIDLLPIDACREFSQIPAAAPAAAWSEVQEYVQQELGIEIDQEFLAVEPMPYRTSLLLDSYVGMLKTEENVSLQVLRSEFRSFPDDQVEALNILSDCTIFQHWADFAVPTMIEDFARELRLRIDQLETAAALEAIGADGVDTSLGLRVLGKCCRRGVLVLQQPPTTLSSIRDHRCNSEPNIPVTRLTEMSIEKLAPALCLSWLKLVLHGRVFPVSFGLDDIALLQDGRTTFLGESFASCGPDSAETLWRYLIAAAADDPDECCGILLSMMTDTGTSNRWSTQTHGDALAAFRQSVTCFMSAPGQQDFCSGVAARVLRQLQIATELGYRPKPFLVSFYRGLFSVLSVVREVQPWGDPLIEGLEGVWLTNIFGSAGKAMRMNPLLDMSGKYLAALMEFPVKLDAALSNALRKNENLEQEWHASSTGDSPYLVSSVIILVAVFLLFRYGPIPIPRFWVDRLTFSICCVIGILMLRLVARA
jgi:hypothetical protein